MSFLRPELQASRLYDGFQFTVHEGPRIVARRTITKLLNEELRKEARNDPI